MNSKGNRFFLGGNTPKGFYSFFSEVMPLKDANRIFCLKGGPGTGKSSLMKELGKEYEDKGYNVEYFHCSSDSDSLDCVLLKDLNIAILDGTAPHTTDPKVPGAIDEIVNLGQHWNEEGIKKYKTDILSVQNSITNNFNRAYKYFNAASIIHEDWSSLNREALNLNKFNFLMEELKDKLYKSTVSSMGSCRNLFITAFTPTGIVTFLDNLVDRCDTTYVLNGPPGTGKHEILSYLRDEGLKRGFHIDVFHSPIVPEKIEHIYIQELNTSVISSNELNQQLYHGHQVYMENYLNYDTINCLNEKIIDAKNCFYTLLNKGLSILTEAKKAHDDIEKYYIPNMNFDEIKDVKKYIVDKITSIESSLSK